MLYYTENVVLHRQYIDDDKLFKKFLTVLILWSFNVEVHVWATSSTTEMAVAFARKEILSWTRHSHHVCLIKA